MSNTTITTKIDLSNTRQMKEIIKEFHSAPHSSINQKISKFLIQEDDNLLILAIKQKNKGFFEYLLKNFPNKIKMLSQKNNCCLWDTVKDLNNPEMSVYLEKLIDAGFDINDKSNKKYHKKLLYADNRGNVLGSYLLHLAGLISIPKKEIPIINEKIDILIEKGCSLNQELKYLNNDKGDFISCIVDINNNEIKTKLLKTLIGNQDQVSLDIYNLFDGLKKTKRNLEIQLLLVELFTINSPVKVIEGFYKDFMGTNSVDLSDDDNGIKETLQRYKTFVNDQIHNDNEKHCLVLSQFLEKQIILKKSSQKPLKSSISASRLL